MAGPFFPPWSPHDYHAEVEAPQPSIRGPYPSSWPSDATLPLSCTPEQYDSHCTAHQCNFLHGLDDPVYGPAKTEAIFPRPQE